MTPTDSSAIRYVDVKLDLKQVDAKERIIVGYAAVFENLDRNGDIIKEGAFAESIAGGLGAIEVLVGHDRSTLPVGIPISAVEDNVGLLTTARIIDSKLGDDLLTTATALKAAGRALGMSIGFIPIDASFERRDNDLVRILSKVRLIEWSYLAAGFIANQSAVVLDVKEAIMGQDTDTALLREARAELAVLLANGPGEDIKAWLAEVDLKHAAVRTATGVIDVVTDGTDAGDGDEHTNPDEAKMAERATVAHATAALANIAAMSRGK